MRDADVILSLQPVPDFPDIGPFGPVYFLKSRQVVKEENGIPPGTTVFETREDQELSRLVVCRSSFEYLVPDMPHDLIARRILRLVVFRNRIEVDTGPFLGKHMHVARTHLGSR